MTAGVNPWIAAILGVVEGLTEYLPVSSTGHLILVSRWLGLSGEGSTRRRRHPARRHPAVVVHYRTLLAARVSGLFRWQRESVSLATALLLGFVPTAVVGLLLRKKIKALLFGEGPVALALVVGGVVMIAVELLRSKRTPGMDGLEHVTPKRALIIGLGQCVSMWPGSSRSMCTILAGQLAGLSTATAAEFSFLLGLPTLGAATLYEMMKSAKRRALGTANVAIGLVVSFVVAWAVIAAFIAYLRRFGLLPFGVYRIVVGLIVFRYLVMA